MSNSFEIIWVELYREFEFRLLNRTWFQVNRFELFKFLDAWAYVIWRPVKLTTSRSLAMNQAQAQAHLGSLFFFLRSLRRGKHIVFTWVFLYYFCFFNQSIKCYKKKYVLINKNLRFVLLFLNATSIANFTIFSVFKDKVSIYFL